MLTSFAYIYDFLAIIRPLTMRMRIIFSLVIITFVVGVALRILTSVVLAGLTAAILEDDPKWMMLGVVYALIFLGIRVFQELSTTTYAIFEQQIQRNVALRIFDDFYSIRFDNILAKQPSEYVIIVDRGLTAVRNILFNSMFFLLPSVLEVIVVLVIITVKTHILIGLFAAIIMVAFVVLTYVISKTIQARSRQLFRTSTTSYKVLSESLRSYLLVRSLNIANWIRQRYDRTHKKLIRDATGVIKPSVLLGMIQGLLFMLLMLIVSAVIMTHDGSTAEQVAQFVLVNSLILKILDPLLGFSSAYEGLITELSGAHQLYEMLKLPKGPQKIPVAPLDSKELAFRLTDLELQLNAKTVVAIDKLDIAQVNFLGVWGASGSGKTSLGKILAGLVEYSGQLASVYDVEQIYFCHQQPPIFDLSLTDNLCLGQSYSQEDVKQALAMAGLDNDELASLGGDYLGESGSRVSGGQRKRIGIARMLLCDVKVMIFDEPTAELDDLVSQRIIETLIRISQQDRMVVVITHDHRLASCCDMLIHMEHGKIKSVTHNNL